jgi:hypothetical protein
MFIENFGMGLKFFEFLKGLTECFGSFLKLSEEMDGSAGGGSKL